LSETSGFLAFKHTQKVKAEMEEETPWTGIENGIDDPEELQVIYRTLDSYQ
jgi:hypothetical protein